MFETTLKFISCCNSSHTLTYFARKYFKRKLHRWEDLILFIWVFWRDLQKSQVFTQENHESGTSDPGNTVLSTSMLYNKGTDPLIRLHKKWIC